MKIEIDLQPFSVPNFVLTKSQTGLRQDGMQPNPSFPLSAVSAATLEQLCDEFRREVFKKAGKRDPEWDRPKQANGPEGGES